MVNRNDWGRAPPQDPRAFYPQPVDVNRLTTHIWPVIGGMFFILASIIPAAIWGSSQFTTVIAKLDQIPDQINVAIAPVASRVVTLEKGQELRDQAFRAELEKRTAQRWTKADHLLWCSRTEQVNPGWKCGNHIVAGGLMGQDIEEMPPVWLGIPDPKR